MDHIAHRGDETVELNNVSADYCQIALQGPDALAILQQLTDTALAEIKYYHFTDGQVDGVDGNHLAHGYTGEDGFEVYAAADKAEQLWNKILDAGNLRLRHRRASLRPGRAQHLRLEAGMALYGHEIDETTTLLEANLGWICKLNKGDFIGREALAKQKEEGVKRRLVGFEVTERGIARDEQEVVD